MIEQTSLSLVKKNLLIFCLSIYREMLALYWCWGFFVVVVAFPIFQCTLSPRAAHWSIQATASGGLWYKVSKRIKGSNLNCATYV